MATQPNFKSIVSIHTQKRNDLFRKLFEGKTPVDINELATNCANVPSIGEGKFLL